MFLILPENNHREEVQGSSSPCRYLCHAAFDNAVDADDASCLTVPTRRMRRVMTSHAALTLFTSLPHAFAHPRRTIPWEYQSENGSRRLEGSKKRECAYVTSRRRLVQLARFAHCLDAQRLMDDAA